MKPINKKGTISILMCNKKAVFIISPIPEDREKSLASMSAFGHWNHYHKVNNLGPPKVYYNKLSSLLGFEPQLDFLDKDTYKGKAWGIEYGGGLKCVITHSKLGTGLLVPKTYTQNEPSSTRGVKKFTNTRQ